LEESDEELLVILLEEEDPDRTLEIPKAPGPHKNENEVEYLD